MTTSPHVTPLASSTWYERRSRSIGYHLALGAYLSLSFWLIMLVPYHYDQRNRRSFEAALAKDQLVIAEFRDIFGALLLDDLHRPSGAGQPQNAQPPQAPRLRYEDLFRSLEDKRVISLDYISKLRAAQSLRLGDFLWRVFPVWLLLMIGLGIAWWRVHSATGRMITITIGFFLSLVSVNLLATLPHKNIKFYYIVGTVFTIVLGMIEYFHAVELHVPSDRGDRVAALQYAHRRWLAVFNMTLAIIVTLIGTVSFNIIDYMTTTFGDSFIFPPLVGAVIVLLFSLVGLIWGVMRNLFNILKEVEREIGGVPEERATA